MKKYKAATHFFIFFSVLITFFFIAGGATVNTTSTTNDTIPKKIYYIARFTLQEWQGKFDTINAVVERLGESLSVDEAKKLKGYLFSALNFNLKPDTLVHRK